MLIKPIVLMGILLAMAYPMTGVADEAVWSPKPGDTFDWQLTEPFDFNRSTDILDLDLFDAEPKTLQVLKSKGMRLVCYLNAGAWEDWRPDAGAFPGSVLGKPYDGWPGERWLDVRNLETLAPLIRARLDLCRAKGFDSIEPDNINAHDNDTGFAITRADQIRYNLWLSREAHLRGLSIALKNTPDLLPELSKAFDWALLEDCHAQGWCAELKPFVDAGKAVIAVEYADQALDWPETCRHATNLRMQAVLKTRELDSHLQRCK